jgi:hypothetical protein
MTSYIIHNNLRKVTMVKKPSHRWRVFPILDFHTDCPDNRDHRLVDLAPENWSRGNERFPEYNVAEVQSI